MAQPFERTWQIRAILFFYSNANIYGLALALLGPALLFLGVIHKGWLLVTLGLYVSGWLLAWSLHQSPEIERSIADRLSNEETMQHLDTLIINVKSHLSTDMFDHLNSIRASIAEVLPRLQLNSGDDNVFTVRETVLRYLPETLANYVALPAAFRVSHVIAGSGGKTAKQILSDQLAILDLKMQEVVTNVASADVQALIANGNFLRSKFQQVDFLDSHVFAGSDSKSN